MFPKLDDYDSGDPRQLILYSWHFDLFALKELIEFTNSGLNEKISSNIRIAQQNVGNYELYDEAMMVVQEYHSISPLAFQSFLLSLYSVVEASLDRYCSICQEQLSLKIKLEDFSDKGITRAISYLEKVIETENVKSDYRWGKMRVINDLRNDLIHSSGMVTSSKKVNAYKSELGVEVVDGKVYILYENIVDIYEHINRFMVFVFSRDFTKQKKLGSGGKGTAEM